MEYYVCMLFYAIIFIKVKWVLCRNIYGKHIFIVLIKGDGQYV